MLGRGQAPSVCWCNVRQHCAQPGRLRLLPLQPRCKALRRSRRGCVFGGQLRHAQVLKLQLADGFVAATSLLPGSGRLGQHGRGFVFLLLFTESSRNKEQSLAQIIELI